MKRNEVEYTLTVLPEDQPVRGNLICSGDDEYDKRLEDEILERLDNGDEWAWCIVLVTARWRSFTGVDYLGGCSYANEEEFRHPEGYYPQMKEAALADLENQILQSLDDAAEYWDADVRY